LKKIEILFRKFLLSCLLLFRKNAQQKDFPVISKESKILFIRLNRIGDALVTTPLLKEIKEQTGCKIYVLAGSQNYFVFENPKLADEIIVYRKSIHGIRALIKLINNLECDAIVDLHDDVSSTVSYLIAFTKSRYKFGLKKKNAKLYTHTVNKLDPSKNHVVNRMLEFGKLFGLKLNPEKANIFFEPKLTSTKSAEEFIKNNYPPKKFLVGINISAGNEARFWGVANYKQLIAELSNYDVNVLLLCSPQDLNNATQISNTKIPIYYRPTFDEFCAMIPLLDLLFTPDTSIVHVASVFHKPLFGLYVKYNTNDKIWSPYKSEFDSIITEEPTLENISFDQVKNKFIPFFEKIYIPKDRYE
jgi:ADP-heptose:LPS heptosyltransferase